MLTTLVVKNAKAKEKPYKLSDGGGLFLLVKSAGLKYWRLAYRFGGKQKTLALGVYPEVSLLEAREARENAKRQIRSGVDPAETRRAEKASNSTAMANTFSVIAEEWYQRNIKTWAASTAKKRRWLMDKNLVPYLGKYPINELKTIDLLKVIQRLETRGAIETAYNALQVMGQIFRYAVQTQRIEHNPVPDLAGSIQAKVVKPRAAITEPAELGRLLVDIDGYYGSHVVRTMLALAPLLFQRPGEVAGMEWNELDLDGALWIIPKERKKERNTREDDHIVPLSRQAVALLRDIYPLTGHSRYVFTNQQRESKSATPASVNKAMRKMGYCTKNTQSFHGFRATARTMLDERLGFPVEWIEHQSGRSVRDPLGRTYNRTKHLDQRIDMIQKWADYLDELKGQTLAGNVIAGSFQQRR
ncbi:integrase [Sinobacterium caligoides]|uniref:Integrase n=1 Tax=Sinobacterium caligoides TaxID=933926 RepID=A0A3N2E0V3_9GAMM|nr:integrase arm-type DNA-binding domain-containing protein [Sinobacterium caligoides]ROS05740.1 integrase [Sinobacterium caligoides]